jgi:26S proteasome regulatory subunit T5
LLASKVRDAFELAKEKIKDGDRKGAIVFVDELDAIGTKRFGGEQVRVAERRKKKILSSENLFSSEFCILLLDQPPHQS